MLNITKTFVFKLLYYFIWLLFGMVLRIKCSLIILYVMLSNKQHKQTNFNINKLINLMRHKWNGNDFCTQKNHGI